ncbi:MAG: hypothetical protein K1W24_05090 [Lachnospiraceae bacterium]
MEYLKTVTQIKKYILTILIMLVLAPGCGKVNVKTATNNSMANKQISTTVYNKDSNNKTDNITSVKKENKTNANKKTAKNLYKNVPVYSKNEEKKIKKYLASLPDTINEKEAEKKGIVIQNIYNNKKKEKKFFNMWQDFYKYTREGEDAENPKDGVIKCYAEPFKAAIVILRYTTEGDACYTYISFIENEYYVYNDTSRDKFGCKSSICDGYSEIGTFKSLRKRREVVKDGNEKYSSIVYSVYKKPGISQKEMKKVMKQINAYANKYYDIYECDN